MDIMLFKILGTVAIFIVMLIFGYLPIRLPSFRTNKDLLSLSNCFSGGLFIAIGLIHILPEAHESLEGSWEKKNGGGEEKEVFPLSYLICLASFSFILLIDKVIFNSTDYIEGEKNHIDLSHSMLKKSHSQSINENFQELTSNKYKLALKLSSLNLEKQHHHHPHDENDFEEYTRIIGNDEDHESNGHHHHENEEINIEKQYNSETEMHNKKNKDINFIPEEKNESNRTRTLSHESQREFKTDFTETESKSNILNIEEDKKDKTHHHKHEKEHEHHQHEKHDENGHHGHHGHHHKMITKNDSMLSCYILLLAMGIHGFFAGIAFGISTTFLETLNMFIAMISHKWSESLTVGISFVSADIPFNTAIKFMLFFTCIYPLGVIVGCYLSGMNDVVVGVAQALSAGTFIYISCAEIIIEEFALAEKKFMKFLMYVFGILFVVCIGFLE